MPGSLASVLTGCGDLNLISARLPKLFPPALPVTRCIKGGEGRLEYQGLSFLDALPTLPRSLPHNPSTCNCCPSVVALRELSLLDPVNICKYREQ